MYRLLATSATEKGILQCIGAYWYSPPAAYYLEGERIMRAHAKTHLIGFRVVQKKGRYRFEAESPKR